MSWDKQTIADGGDFMKGMKNEIAATGSNTARQESCCSFSLLWPRRPNLRLRTPGCGFYRAIYRRGVYFSLSNVSSQSVVLVGAESAAYERVMIHQSTEKDGMASMEQVLQLEFAPSQTVNFAPGSYHLMLMKPLGSLAIGEVVSLTLLFVDEFRLPVTFQVVSPASQ